MRNQVIVLVIGAYLAWIGYTKKVMQKSTGIVFHNNLGFSQMSQASPIYKALHDPWCLYFWFMTGKSSWVHSRTQGIVPIVVADGQMYYGYCSNCLYPAMGDN
jgi:hypothetical protein